MRLSKHTPRVLVIAMLVATGLVLALGKYPHHELANSRATTAAKIVGAPAFVVAIRIVVMYAVVFVLASVLARIWNGHWLRKAGPFEVADEVQTLKDERDRLRNEAIAAGGRIQTLTRRLEEAYDDLQKIGEAVETATEGRLRLPVKLRTLRRPSEE